jgi:hypothetical protein
VIQNDSIKSPLFDFSFRNSFVSQEGKLHSLATDIVEGSAYGHSLVASSCSNSDNLDDSTPKSHNQDKLVDTSARMFNSTTTNQNKEIPKTV